MPVQYSGGTILFAARFRNSRNVPCKQGCGGLSAEKQQFQLWGVAELCHWPAFQHWGISLCRWHSLCKSVVATVCLESVLL